MEGGVEDSYLFYAWENLFAGHNAGKIVRVVEWGKAGESFDFFENFGVDFCGFAVFFSTVHDAMADDFDLVVWKQTDDLFDRRFVGFDL